MTIQTSKPQIPSPEGTSERDRYEGLQSLNRFFSRPFGTRTHPTAVPNLERLDYFQLIPSGWETWTPPVHFFRRAVMCAALVVVLISFSGCSQKSSATDKKTNGSLVVPVVVTQAIAQDFPIELRNIGNVEAYATVTIRSQITGQITKIHFREGQEVKAGDLLFTIDPRPSQGALRQAQADLRRDQAQLVSVKLDFERQKKLFESNIASKDDYDKAEALFHALEA